MNHNTDLGSQGESLAAEYLELRGLSLLQQNWRGKSGEIDLVMQSAEEIVFVEVKTRRTMLYGDPLSAVTAQKLQRIHRLAEEWQHEQQRRVRYRIDIVGIVFDGTDKPSFEHLERVMV
ncbi:MAG: YraN family protein [Microbacteriaceae bacterium]